MSKTRQNAGFSVLDSTIFLILFSYFAGTFGTPLPSIRRRRNPWTGSGCAVSKTRQNAGFSSLDCTFLLFCFHILQEPSENHWPQFTVTTTAAPEVSMERRGSIKMEVFHAWIYEILKNKRWVSFKHIRWSFLQLRRCVILIYCGNIL